MKHHSDSQQINMNMLAITVEPMMQIVCRYYWIFPCSEMTAWPKQPCLALSVKHDVWVLQTAVTSGPEVKKKGISLKIWGSAKTRIESEEKDILQDVTMCEGQQSKDISHSLSFEKVSAIQKQPKHHHITSSRSNE